jgi:hypothetical protein
VDAARGLAVFGMMATHVFDTFGDDGSARSATIIAAGRSAATFALIAGISVAFLSGGRDVVRGRARTAAAAGLVVRALLIGMIGLLLGSTDFPYTVILAFYGLMLLLAIPLLPLSPRMLGALAVGLIALGPVLLVVLARLGVEFTYTGDPTVGTLVSDPIGLFVQLLITGSYPVVVYLAYLCVGLAIGRLDLSSRRLAWWLFGGGIALAVTARVVSLTLLYPLCGLARLLAQTQLDGDPASASERLMWEADQGTSWWWLALPAPHSHTTIDLVHTLGSAMAVLGACLLLTRIAALRRIFGPLEAAGGMPLTLYTGHAFALAAAAPLEEHQMALYLVLVATALIFAVVWRRLFGQGPLERVVTVAATRARLAVLGSTAAHQSR